MRFPDSARIRWTAAWSSEEGGDDDSGTAADMDESTAESALSFYFREAALSMIQRGAHVAYASGNGMITTCMEPAKEHGVYE